MFSAVEWMVALRYMRARRAEGFISVIAGFSLIGIALGVATLIIVLSVMNGFRTELLDRILGLNGHIAVVSSTGALSDYDSLAERVRVVEGVLTVTPLVEGQVLATSGGRSAGAMVRGLTAEALAMRSSVADNIRMGSVSDFTSDNAVVLGSRLARSLGLRVGDKVTLVSPRGTVTAFGTVPRMQAYRVVATFEIGMFEFDSSFIFMPLSAAQKYFRLGDTVNQLEVFVDNPDNFERQRAAISGVIDADHRVFDWQEANGSFFNALQVERNVMFLILTLIILVAAFNIISSLIMLVKDKGSAIAILRTVGASRGMVMRVFFIVGASVGVVGTLIGAILGLVFSENIEAIRQVLESLTGTDLFAAEIYFLSQLPAEVDNGEVTLVVFMALGLSILATLYPSWRASRLDPVEALRNE
ncbi:MAG: lipoprotein-releasing system transmembrane subunit LolC [Alphaproteobacteria bacterium]|nr:lipoprotein-releasing system transmembrane subunit LolC [Alphaproteobacteria bacterium]